MTRSKHTPGPWECDPIGHEVYETDRDTVIATLPLVRSIADARLIAAAPDLLESVYSLLKIASRNELLDLMTKEEKTAAHYARAALAKARGESQTTA